MSCPKGAIEANTRSHIAVVEAGAARGAGIVVFPEMSLTGSVDPVNWTGHAVPLTHPALAEVAAAADRLGVTALVGLAEDFGGDVHITQVLVDGGRVVAHYRKRTLGEGEGSYRAGSDVVAFALGSTPIGIAICAEAGVDAPFDDAAAAGAWVVSCARRPVSTVGVPTKRAGSAASTGGRDRRSVTWPVTRAAAWLWIALSTQAGATADEDFPGLAALVDPNGDVVSALPDWHEGTLLVDLPL